MNAAETLLLKSVESRLESPLDILGDQVLLKLGGRDSAGQLTVMMGITPPKAGPPLHRHSREDESFYVLEGEYLFEVDGKQFHARARNFCVSPARDGAYLSECDRQSRQIADHHAAGRSGKLFRGG